MDMLRHLNDAMVYIEANLDGEIDTERIALLACVSGDSFARFFSYMTGMTLTEYIRRRRLSLAAEALRSGARVIDAAVQFGWNSADAFAKAFVRQHGISPAQARDVHAPLRL